MISDMSRTQRAALVDIVSTGFGRAENKGTLIAAGAFVTV